MMVANIRIIGAAEGTIMAIIITIHMTNMAAQWAALQDCMLGMAIAVPGAAPMLLAT